MKALDYLDKQSSSGIIEDAIVALDALSVETQLTIEEKLVIHYQARDYDALQHLMYLQKKIKELKELIT